MNLFFKGTKEKDEEMEKSVYNRLRGGDDKAFIEAYDLYVDQIYRFVFFKLGNKEDAQDVTSSVFLKAWNYIQKDGLEEYETLRALLYTISRNSVIDHYRKHRRGNADNIISIDNGNVGLDIKDEKKDVAHEMDIKLGMELIKTKLSEIKDEYREIIILKYIEELSAKEISKILKKSSGNIRVMSYRALNALQELVSEEKDKLQNQKSKNKSGK